jgi:hypothetical protein
MFPAVWTATVQILCILKITKGCQAGNLLPLPRLYTDDIDNFLVQANDNNGVEIYDEKKEF